MASTVIEFIELQARGVVDLMDQIDAVKASTTAATDAAVVMNKVLQDPKNREAIRNLEAIRQANAGLLQVEQARVRLANSRDQAYGRDAMANAHKRIALQREQLQVERDLQRLRVAARASLSASPAGMADVRDRLALAKMEEAQRRIEARNDLAARREYSVSPQAATEAKTRLELLRMEEAQRRMDSQTDLAARRGYSMSPQAAAEAKDRLALAKMEEAQRRMDSQTDRGARRDVAGSPAGMADARDRLRDAQEEVRLRRQEIANELRAKAQFMRTPEAKADATAAALAARKEQLADLAQKRLDVAAQRDLAAGTNGVRDARLRLRVERDVMELHKQQRRNDLDARYGRAGGRLAAFGESRGFQLATGTAAAGSAGVLAAAASGFSDTVEMHTFRTNLMFMNREIAGAFVPALREATGVVKLTRMGLASMSGAQQRMLAVTTLSIAALAAFNVALYRTTGMTVTGLGASALGRLGGGAAAGVGSQAAAAASGGIGGAAAKFAAGGGPIGLGIAGAFAGATAVGAGVSSDYNSYREATSTRGKAIAAANGLQNLDPTSAVISAIRRNFFGSDTPSSRPKDDKTAVTPMLPTLFSEAGSTWEEFALAAANTTGSGDAAAAAATDRLTGWLQERFGKGPEAVNPP